MTADPRLIVTLDLPTVAEARAMVERLGDAIGFYKIGLQLLATEGMAFAAELKASGRQVFLDWKLHDIGATVEKAAAALAETGAGDVLTVHAEPQVMAAARRGVEGSRLKVLGVTVLTSLSDADLRGIGYAESPAALVERGVQQAVEAGARDYRGNAGMRRPIAAAAGHSHKRRAISLEVDGQALAFPVAVAGGLQAAWTALLGRRRLRPRLPAARARLFQRPPRGVPDGARGGTRVARGHERRLAA